MKTFNKIIKKFIPFYVLFILAACASSPSNLEIAKEYPMSNEELIRKDLAIAIREDLAKKYEGKKNLRDAHPKHYGCVKAEFEIPNLSEELKVGLFKKAGKYSSWIRFSSALSSVESDEKKTLMGMAIKLIGIEGDKLLEHEKNEKTQDFLLASGPIHPMKNSEEFLKLVNRGIWYFINPFDSHFHELGLIMSGRKRHATPLETRYWSGTPYLFGEGKAVKYSAKPCNEPTRKIPQTLTENYLREAMADGLSKGDVCFDFMVQFQADANSMLIEDPRVAWDENISPFKKVATIKIPKQTFDSEKQMEFCENTNFTPWRSIASHKPIGNINRARKDVYLEISKFRLEKNGIVPKEPNGKEQF